MNPCNALYLHRIHLDLPKLMEFFKKRRLVDSSGNFDFGYGLHSVLRELFGELAPQPFHHVGCFGQSCEVLGYSRFDASALNQHASMFADPLLHNIVDWNSHAAKKMPDKFDIGLQISFEIRICPIKRSRNTTILGHKPQGALREYDAYLTFNNKGISRDHVYGQWLKQILEDKGGVKVLKTSLVRFVMNHNNLQRRGQTRNLSSLGTRPDATISGVIEVVDPSSFQSLLACGIGRHKAFGFGMLLLKPLTKAD